MTSKDNDRQEASRLETLSRLIAMASVEARHNPQTAMVAHFLDIALMELGAVRRQERRQERESARHDVPDDRDRRAAPEIPESQAAPA